MEDALKQNPPCNACHALAEHADLLAERLTIFLLLAPKHVWDSIQDNSVLVSASNPLLLMGAKSQHSHKVLLGYHDAKFLHGQLALE